MSAKDFLDARGLSSIANVTHKHPFSGSDYSILSLLESFQRYMRLEDQFNMFINSSSDACSLEATLAEQTDREWRGYVRNNLTVS